MQRTGARNGGAPQKGAGVPATDKVSGLRLTHQVLAALTAIAFLFVWSAPSAQATTLTAVDESAPVSSSGFVSAGDEVQYLDTADGRWVVETDKAAREMTVTSPGGEVEHFGPDSPIWTETLPSANPDAKGSNGLMQATNSTACTWAVWFIGAIHTGGWSYAVGLLALNPPAALALTAVVTLGYGAFWNWVSTQC